jgi:hypothetical protein
MNLYVQYAIVAAAILSAAWVSWRKLTGRNVLRSGRKTDGCASCESGTAHGKRATSVSTNRSAR